MLTFRERDGFVFGPDFTARLTAQRAFVNTLTFETESPSGYLHKLGDYGSHRTILYGNQPVMDAFPIGRKFKQDELRGSERYLRDLIEELIVGKQSLNQPVVMLDVGGMAGMSWVRLAGHFREDIASNRALFVVSNLTYLPDLHLEQLPINQDDKNYLREQGHLVKYVRVNPAELGHISLDLPHGHSRLLHHVDLLHESDSVSKYSQSPEDDIYRLGQLLSNEGVYFSFGGISQRDSRKQLEEATDMHQAAVLAAQQNLVRKLGLIKVTRVEEGEKKGHPLKCVVFRKPSAPPVALD